MNLVVKPVFTNPFRIIPVSAVIRYTVGTVTPTIWFPLKAMVIIRGIVIAVFNTTILKTSGGVKELLIAVGTVEFNPVGVFLDIRKDFITDVVTVSFSENKFAKKAIHTNRTSRMIGERRTTTNVLVLSLFFFTIFTTDQFFILYHFYILQVNMIHQSCVNVCCQNLRTKYLNF